MGIAKKIPNKIHQEPSISFSLASIASEMRIRKPFFVPPHYGKNGEKRARLVLKLSWLHLGMLWVITCLLDAGEHGYLRVAAAEMAEDAAAEGGPRTLIKVPFVASGGFTYIRCGQSTSGYEVARKRLQALWER